MSLLRAPWHLVKRFVGNITAAPLTLVERSEVVAVLLPTEYRLFEQFSVADQRHALHVLRRFDSFAPGAPVFVRRAALLHDIGKVEARLGTIGRVVATVVGPRTPAFRRYHQHEELGLQLLRDAGSDSLTLEVLTPHSSSPWCDALARADAI